MCIHNVLFTSEVGATICRAFLLLVGFYFQTLAVVQVQQRRKDALLQTGDEGAASAESSLQQLVSRYRYLDLWPCSAQDLDYLARQQVYLCFLVLRI